MMKRKIDATNGTTYVYEFADGTKCKLTAGNDGVSEDIIKSLKRMDNRSYEKDLDFWGSKMNKQEKEEFEALHPGEKVPRKWNASLDYVGTDGSREAEKILYHELSNPGSINADPQAERLHELMEQMPPMQKLVIQYLLDGYKQAEIARELKLSPSTIRDHWNAAKKFIQKNF
ncbi:RNA polymerase sigma factor [Ileibacterium valens]|uniref:RNA polymerase sigma factor n=2 Tax=Ileibacterium valens TaxID=1862668 RepID=UPI002352C240|nr:sigma-70 family RNA polymerase sigma factor [Ileibacterium valens]